MNWVVWKDEFGKHRTKVIEFEGQLGMEVRWTSACSGCYESEDGYPVGSYPFDEKAGCYIGAGCGECGYKGKRRNRSWIPLPKEASVKLADRGKN